MPRQDQNPWESYPNYRNVTELAERNARRNVWDIQYRRILSVWPYMIASAILFMVVAASYLRYQTDVYELSISIVVEDNQEMGMSQALFSNRDPLNNQIAILKSPALARRVVDSMGLNYHAKIKGRFKDKELFQNISWRVLERPDSLRGEYIRFEGTPQGDGFTWKSGGLQGKAYWGKPFQIGAAKIILDQHKYRSGSSFICYEENPEREAFRLSDMLKVSSSKESNVLTISIKDVLPERAIAVFHYLVNNYNDQILQEKSRSLQQSLAFIQKRLTPLTDELDSIETALARYQSEKGIINRSTNGGLYLAKTQEYDQELNTIDLQKSVLQSAEAFLRSPSTKESQMMMPYVADSYLNGLLTQYQELRQERDKMAINVTAENPQLKLLEKRMSEVKENIDVQIANYKKNIRLLETNYTEKMGEAKRLLSNTPEEEKTLLEKQRQQNIKQSLFLMMLQRKEEAGIALAALSVKTTVIRQATVPDSPVSPKRKEILLGALFIGLWIPLGFTILKEFLNNKIISKSQLQQMASAPVLAELDEVEKSKHILEVGHKERSIFGEQVRALRANLKFYMKPGKNFFVMLTSSMSGEGKSFISANLARSFSLQEKKVALLEFDLRRPKLAERFGIKATHGLTHFLIGRAKFEELAIPVTEDGYLHLFASGPIPPNPSELLVKEKMDELFDYLEKHYDVIIIDTPPYGIVADAQLMKDRVDVTLVVARFRYTIREQVHEIEDWSRNNIFPNMAILFNGIRSKGYYGYKYGYYASKRKYGYSYYHGSKDGSSEQDSSNNE